MYAAEWPCCHDPLRFSLGSDDLSPQRGNPTRRTPNACLLLSSLSRLALLPRAPRSWGGAARTERFYAAARAWREGLCVSRTRPHALCVPHPFAFLFERLSPPFEAIHFLNPFGRRGPRTRREGLCVSSTASHQHALRILSFPTKRRFSRTRREGLSRPLRPFAFLFERLSPVIFSTPLAGAAFSDFRRFPRTRSEGLCVMRTASHQRFAFLPFH